MSRKIKLHSLHFLFQIFSFLADKTGGWRLFVKPKLIIGSLILSLGFTACNTKSDNSNTQNNNSTNNSDSIESLTECYKTDVEIKPDSTPKTNNNKKNKFSEPRTTCFDSEVIKNEKESVKSDSLSKTNSKKTIYGNDEVDGVITCYEVVEVPQKPNTIYDVVEEMPQFQGGYEALFKYLSSEIKYPNTEGCVQGRVICRFVVEKDGSIGNIEVLRKVDPSFDKEAVRVIRKMPKWIPGKHKGEIVRVWYTIPINIKLQ